MSRIKPVLVDRFNEWRAAHPDEPLVPIFTDADPGDHRQRDMEAVMAEEAARWKEQREEREREMRRYPSSSSRPNHRSRKEQAAVGMYNSSVPDYSFSQPPNTHGSQSTIVVMPDDAERRRAEREEKRRRDQEGIARRQQEAEVEAHQIRQTIAINSTHQPGTLDVTHQHGTLSAQSSASSVGTNGSSPMFISHTQASSLATTPASSFYHAPPPPPAPQPNVQPPQPPQAAVPITTAPPPAQPVTPVRTSHTSSANEPPAFLFPGFSSLEVHRTPTRATVRRSVNWITLYYIPCS